MQTNKPSKTKTSFYRRIYLAYLIDSGINTVPAIIDMTGMPKRTAQDTLAALKELGINVEFIGGTKNGHYQINDWGAVSKTWVTNNLKHVKDVLMYP
ncbi:winged helix-turn-helix domain-containing protein [Teredinibacter purpureus]|uniref:winged helix-turn-helix domain-containing protein n=1 Tax=Teredinibacter purpureus TaxID=2731756 RepID=UPI0005F861AA|nr:winged helix-turn-helix domain-containing protein [Teredinibacter purpureus]